MSFKSFKKTCVTTSQSLGGLPFAEGTLSQVPALRKHRSPGFLERVNEQGATGQNDEETCPSTKAEVVASSEPRTADKPSGDTKDGEVCAPPSGADLSTLGLPEALRLATDVEVPPAINVGLYPHQRDGIKFLFTLYQENRGGVLGDDMGLGKTVQAVVFIRAILAKKLAEAQKEGAVPAPPPVFSDPSSRVPDNPDATGIVVLVVAPTSVLENWERECATWGDFRVGIFHGKRREGVLERTRAGTLDVVLTSYDTLRLSAGDLLNIGWHCVILDEIHRLKNVTSKTYVACSQLRTSRRYGLTGTVMQNNYMELHAVLDWVAPNWSGTRADFRSHFDRPMRLGQRINAPDVLSKKGEERLADLHGLLKKHMLRRTKDVIGHLLKGKDDYVAFCSMSPLQRRVYKRVLESPDFQVLVRKDEPCDCGRPSARSECCHSHARDGVLWRYVHRDTGGECLHPVRPLCMAFPCLTKLLQVSNHVELLKPQPDEPAEKQAADAAFAALVLADDAPAVGGVSADARFLGRSDSTHCGKMGALRQLLQGWIRARPGEKVLVFTYSVRMLNILDAFLLRAGYNYSRLDGATPMATRQVLVDEFNRSPSKQVFLISTRAGGMGINLATASRVVVFDPNWNPAHDLQAQDRSYRFGQKRHVEVFRLLSAGTMEEVVYMRQIYKQQMFSRVVEGAEEPCYFEGVQDDATHHGELFGLANIFKDHSEKVLTADVLESYGERQLQLAPYVPEGGADGAGEGDYLDTQANAARVSSEAHCSTSHAGSARPGARSRVPDILRGVDVLYIHKNEDIVSGRRAKKRHVEEEDPQGGTGALEHEERVTEGGMQVDGGLRDGSDMETNPAVGTAVVAPEESAMPKSALLDDDKKEKFKRLAESQGMDVKQFSVLIRSLSKEERLQLLRTS